MGLLVHHCLKNVDDDALKRQTLKDVLKHMYTNLSSNDKKVQQAAGLCLTRVIQNGPPDVLIDELPNISDKLLGYISAQGCKAKTQIIESVISLVIAVELHFEEYATQFIPYLIESTAHSDWATRKASIDCTYTLAAILPDALIPFKSELL